MPANFERRSLGSQRGLFFRPQLVNEVQPLSGCAVGDIKPVRNLRVVVPGETP
jgi:hypothetical protein